MHQNTAYLVFKLLPIQGKLLTEAK